MLRVSLTLEAVLTCGFLLLGGMFLVVATNLISLILR
ncbi:hypothetical protein ABH917_001710 [Thermobifida halotolerans]|jgi:hypothetical protein